jgi:hypothetical protein
MNLLLSFRIRILCAAWALAPLALPAQNFTGGLSLGMNASQVDGDGATGFNQAGLNVGGFVRYPLTRSVGLQPEIAFEQLGSSADGFRLLRVSLISVPLMLTTRLPLDLGGEIRQIGVQAGVAGGLMVGARSFNADVSEYFDRFDLRALGGVSFRATNEIELLFRYGYSLTSFIRGEQNPGFSWLVRRGVFHHYVNLSLRWYVVR